MEAGLFLIVVFKTRQMNVVFEYYKHCGSPIFHINDSIYNTFNIRPKKRKLCPIADRFSISKETVCLAILFV